jgi:hypothetical protein
MIFLPQHPLCWDYSHVSLCWAPFDFDLHLLDDFLLNLFSCVYWSLVCLPWGNVYSSSWLFLNWGAYIFVVEM